MSEQWLRLSLEQSLDPEFVYSQTRGEEVYATVLKQQKKGGNNNQSSLPGTVGGNTAADNEDGSGESFDVAVSRGALVNAVLHESRTEHLISGFIGALRGDVLARLARELAALGLSADLS